ncbi:MAG: AbrB/MazE/SpoVT family DNA-binding domain-containing protein [Candidatus Aenigmarchaeota archaeon]|nr:AbrB/MazE/SpoVT family DNA-binding domain-containing protein [Candidatus Aenigmarchaeota archaeon]NIO22962.1 AbrB/MazE/SpoVT family DNA-binding domain-containing protein [Candidatus Aenigmarchaeota archaeon]
MVKASVIGTSVITKQGQITIPKDIRKKLGIKKGDMIQFVITVNGNVIIRKMEFDKELEL